MGGSIAYPSAVQASAPVEFISGFGASQMQGSMTSAYNFWFRRAIMICPM